MLPVRAHRSICCARTGAIGKMEVMEFSTEVPLVGGAADGDVVRVELGPSGRPPLTHHHLGEHGLAEADIYELEAVVGEGPPWVYRWRGPAT
jgi:hypothetical protein